jgi:hypothetical protein
MTCYPIYIANFIILIGYWFDSEVVRVRFLPVTHIGFFASGFILMM